MSAGWAVPDRTPVWRTCSICGAKSDDEGQVHPAMWPTREGRWVSGARCFDRSGCRDRVEAKGLAWTVADGTPAASTDPTSKSPVPQDAPAPPASDPDDEWSFDR